MWINKDDYFKELEATRGPLLRIAEFQATIAAQLKAISESQALLSVNVAERLAALERELALLSGGLCSAEDPLGVGALPLLEQRLLNRLDDRGSLLDYKLKAIAECVGAIGQKLNGFRASRKPRRKR